ncbi:MAG: M13 family metallopeptidase [Byssovorax sp.]
MKYLLGLVASLAMVCTLGCGGGDEDLGPSGLDLDALDRTADPCVDFYQLACGGWVKSHPVGPDAALAAKFYDPYYEALPRIRAILEDDAAGARSDDDPDAPFIGDYYASCLAAPNNSFQRNTLRTILMQIDGIATLDDLARQVADQREIGSGSFFRASVGVDPGDATRRVLILDQGGVELADRSYYLDADQKDVLVKYEAHINAMSALIGGTPIDAAAAIRVETALAEAALPRDQRRDPASLYHLMKAEEVTAMAPAFPWKTFWDRAGFASPAEIDVVVPSYLVALDALFQKMPIDDLKSYLRWQLLQDYASTLDQAFLDEDLAFWGIFTGQVEAPPRWFTCMNDTLDELGDAVALPYVARHFDERAGVTARVAAERVRASFATRLHAAAWLDDPTRGEALAKLDAMVAKIGHPASGPDLAGLALDPGSYLDNHRNLRTFTNARRRARLTMPVDRSEWSLTALTVNAAYSPAANDLTVPAALLTSPFLVADRPDAANFGALGVVLGHEMTHGFDDGGRRFDGTGTLRDWWTPAVEKSFSTRAQCLVDQFDAFEAQPGEHVDGALTLGENIADLGGVTLAHAALFDGSGDERGGDGFSAEQVFFLAYAQTWCENVRPDLRSQWLLTDPHAPGKFRTNGPLSNLPAFREAFSCPANAPMARSTSCAIW